MGISLTDLSNFAVGAIERDREITNENLKVRGEELRANRDLMLAMKKDKYAADIAEYKKEKAKSNEINRLNAIAANQSGGMSKQAYAQQYLLAVHGPEKYKILQSNPETFNKMLNDINVPRDYKFSLDRNTIDKQFEVDTKIVNKGFAKAIENAKGDSFLINKILGKKSSINDDINAVIEDQLKAAKIVKEETVGDDVDLSKIKFTDSKDVPYINKTSDAYKNFRTNNTKYASDLRKANSNKNSADNQLTIAQSFRQLGIANIGDYFETNNEGGIKAFKKGGENFADTIFSQWKMYKDYKINPGTDNLYLGLNKDSVNLVPYYDKENANGEIANRTKEFAVPVANGNISGEGGALNFSNILRNKKDNLIVVPTANSIDFDGTIVGSDIRLTNSEDKVRAKKLYAQALINNSKVNGEINIQKLKQNQDTLQNLEYGKSNTLLEKINNDFINLYKGTTPATDDGTPPPSNNNVSESIKVTFSDGKTLLLPNTEEVRADLEADKDNIINQEIQKNIKQEPTAGDALVAETTMGVNDNIYGNKIKPEGEMGDVNPKFTTLESVLKILPNNMTGKEIKEKYNIDFKINEKSLFRPLK